MGSPSIRNKRKLRPCSRKAAARGRPFKTLFRFSSSMKTTDDSQAVQAGQMPVPNPERRRFLRDGLSVAAGAMVAQSLAPVSAAVVVPSDRVEISPGTVPRKPFGRSGIQVSLFGIGGYHLGTL